MLAAGIDDTNENNLQDLLDMIDSCSNGKQPLSDALIQRTLKGLRSSKVRRSDVVVKYGWNLLNANRIFQDSEKWTVYEQVLVAALDVGDSVIASACLEALESKFPDSSRVKRSKGMLLESEGKYDEAIALYDSVLAKQPSNLLMLKRKVCVHKSRGDTRAVIVALNKILELNAADVSTWVELAEVYAAECDQEAAAFCLEEAVMLTPTNAAIHTRLADFYYSIGGRDGLVKARKHYSTALNFQNLRSGNLRALYGLIMTCRSLTPLLSSAVEAADELALTKELHAWASEELKVYANQFDITGVGNIISVACATFEAK